MTREFPIVDLISAPEEVLRTIYTACRTCYSADYPIDIWDVSSDELKMLGLIKKVLASGHHSTIEHCTFVFAISGVSRACTHQLVRHRHMSFSQKSQRYVTEKDEFEYIIPPTIKKSQLEDEFKDYMSKSAEFYEKLIKAGIPAEDARFVLPNAASSSLVASLNLRELIHLANLRLCTNAQLEIRVLVKKICEAVIEKEPWLAEYLVPKCEVMGYCNEIRSCGRYASKNESKGQ